MSETKKIGYRDVFRQKEYMKMIIASLINRFGDSIDAIAYTWIVYELTGNAAWSAVTFLKSRALEENGASNRVEVKTGAWQPGRAGVFGKEQNFKGHVF